MHIHVPDDLAALVPDLERFISAMVHKLHRNRHKGKWEQIDLHQALDKLRDEVTELQGAIDQGSFADILMEGADVANFALILSSVALNSPPKRGPRVPSSMPPAAAIPQPLGTMRPPGAVGVGGAAPRATETPTESKDEGGLRVAATLADPERLIYQAVVVASDSFDIVGAWDGNTAAGGKLVCQDARDLTPQQLLAAPAPRPGFYIACHSTMSVRLGAKPVRTVYLDLRRRSPQQRMDAALRAVDEARRPPCDECLERSDLVGITPPPTYNHVAPEPSHTMLERRLSDVRRLADVGRWQVVPTIRQENVLAHIGSVVLLAHIFWKWAVAWGAAGRHTHGFDYGELVRAAICHDVGEALTGDLPSPYKKALGGSVSGDRAAQIERAVRLDIVGDYQNQGRIGLAIQWLDTLDAAMFLAEERARGNNRVRAVALDLEAKAQNLAAALTPHSAGRGIGEGVAFMFTTAALNAARDPVSLADPRTVYLGERA